MPPRRTAKRRRNSLLLQTFWTGKPLSRMERAALQSYVNQGYTVDIFTYNPMKEFRTRIPPTPHIRVHDAREILPESEIFEYTGRDTVGARDDAFKYLPFSDLFRFTMLHKRGGAWIDLDIFLTRPIPATVLRRPYIFSAERTIQKGAYRKAEPEVADVGFIKVPRAGSALTTWLLENLPAPNRIGNPRTPFDYMNLYRRAITALGLERYVLPARAFRTLNWWDVKEALAAGSGADDACYPGKYGVKQFCVTEIHSPEVFGIHWFRAILRKRGLPYETASADRPVKDSLYDRMIADIEDDAGFARDSL